MTTPGSDQEVPRWSWLLAGAIGGPLSIFLHEMAHFAAAHFAGAPNIRFEWTAVEADFDGIDATARGFIALAGPVLTVGLLVAAWLYSRRRFNPVVHAIGLVAGVRSLVSLGYIIRSIIGSADSGNFAFDEYDAAIDLGISPLWFSVPSLVAFLAAAGWFGRLLRRRHGRVPVLLVLVGSAVGLLVYATVGPAVV